jgi:hypothetical protein
MTEKEQKIGLTFNQILSLITVSAIFIGGWTAFSRDLTKFKTETNLKIEQLEKGRVENAVNIKELSNENKADHKEIIIKLDALIISFSKKK